jgi:3-hydroxyacyl-[acyl-carrier-protein] dehydratase
VRHSLEIRFSAEHPTAAGHFPGNPIIPGAVLLDEVLHAVAGADTGAAWTIPSAKFLHPVRPGDLLLIRWEQRPGGDIKFECWLREPEQLALTGTVQLREEDR